MVEHEENFDYLYWFFLTAWSALVYSFIFFYNYFLFDKSFILMFLGCAAWISLYLFCKEGKHKTTIIFMVGPLTAMLLTITAIDYFSSFAVENHFEEKHKKASVSYVKEQWHSGCKRIYGIGLTTYDEDGATEEEIKAKAYTDFETSHLVVVRSVVVCSLCHKEAFKSVMDDGPKKIEEPKPNILSR